MKSKAFGLTMIMTVISVIVVVSLIAGKSDHRPIEQKNQGEISNKLIQIESNGHQTNQRSNSAGFTSPLPPLPNEKSSITRINDQREIKAIYITGSTAGSSKRLAYIVDLIKKTELNAVVLDVKDDYGKVNYKSDIADVGSMGASLKVYNVDQVIKKFHENNIYVIGRIVTFKDPFLASKRADLAIKRPGGQIWRENSKTPWINPYNKQAWKYNVDIAKEAVDKGFDEIQFDYVRFPAARATEVSYGESVPLKADVISGFLLYADKELHEGKGVRVSADVFGIICESPADTENIGQHLEKVGMGIDYISPMVYPSHYANVAQNRVGQTINGIKFTAPDLQPYEVVYNTLVKARERISKVQGYKANIRPYLQDFTASWLRKGYYQTYGATQVRQQIQAVYDAGYKEWILWDPNNTYSEGALKAGK